MRILHCDNPGSGAERILNIALTPLMPEAVIDKAGTGEEVLQMIGKHQYDLIVFFFANNVQYRDPPYPERHFLDNLVTLICTLKERCDTPVWAMLPSFRELNPFADQVLRNVADFHCYAPAKIVDMQNVIKQILKD